MSTYTQNEAEEFPSKINFSLQSWEALHIAGIDDTRLISYVDIKQFENWLDNWCRKNPDTHWLSYQETTEQLEESFEQIDMLCWRLIFFIGLKRESLNKRITLSYWSLYHNNVLTLQ